MGTEDTNSHRPSWRRRGAVAALSAAPLAFFAVGASAQTVTIYGNLDTAVEHITNVAPSGGSITREGVLTGGLIPSRLGFRGVEDLGGNLRAVFTMEMGISPSTGTFNQSGRAWGRQEFVGLSGPWGTVSFGRQYSQIFYALIGDTMGPASFSAAQLDTYLPNARMDNSIAYRGTFGNFSLGTTISLGRDTVATVPAGGCAGESTDSKACRQYTFAAQYSDSMWGIAGAWDRQNGGAGTGSPLPLSSQSDTRSLLSGYFKVPYDIKIGLNYLHRNNEGSTTQPRSNLYFGGATWPIGPWVLDALYSKIKFSDTANGGSLYAFRAAYNLSKRTAVYAGAGHITNNGTSTFTLDGAVVSGSSPAAGKNQNGVIAGIRHSW